MRRPDRRTFLAATGATGLMLAGMRPASAADCQALRARWAAALTGGDVFDPADADFAAALGRLDGTVTSALGRLDRGPNRTRVFTDYDFANEGFITNTYVRLEAMATAWSTPGSRFHRSASLLTDTLAGLESTYQLVYHAGTVEYGNWFHWEIGSTKPLSNTMVLLYDVLPADARARYCAAIDHFVPDPYWMFPPERGRIISTGANRVDLCQAVIVRSIVADDHDRLVHARDGLSDVWQYVTTGDGFYKDGSFVQHTTVAYTGTYGHVLLGGIGKLLALLAGSPWAVTDPSRQILFDAVENTYAPVMHDVRMMDFVRGRAVSRATASDHDDGYTAAEAILRLAGGVEPALAARWRGLVAGWLARDTFGNILSGASIPRVALVKTLDAPPTPERDGHHLFASMDRSVHRRGGWAWAISMASRRIACYECGNGENELGFHTGSGMTYLYDGDNGQFADGFWPTVDRYRLPGITVDKLPLPRKAGGEWGEALPPSAVWTGGSTVDGYAAVGQHLEGPVSPMRARKSWFCLDEYIVALGTGIAGSSGYPVETVVENRNLHASGTDALLVDGTRLVPDLGDTATVARPRWAHLGGVGGYVFPCGGSLHAVREARTGSWRDINNSGPTAALTRRYLTLWFDHGVDPGNASYAYLVVPGASPERTTELAARPGVEIVANAPRAQAIRHRGITAVNFWAPGRVAGVAVDAPCSVIIRRVGRELRVAAADPTQLGRTLRVRLDEGGFRRAEPDAGVTVVEFRRHVDLRVDVTAAAGASRRVSLFR